LLFPAVGAAIAGADPGNTIVVLSLEHEPVLDKQSQEQIRPRSNASRSRASRA
jgi:hypothetical protein